MSIRVDFDNKTIHSSVRELVVQRRRRRATGLLQRLRARLGNEIHAAYRERRASTLGDRFRAEVSLSMEHVVEGFAANVRGRADGTIDDGGCVIVEEVKSVLLTGEEMAALASDDLSAHCSQVGIYALCLQVSGEDRPVHARVLLESVVDGTVRVIDADYERARMTARLDRLLRVAIREAEHVRARGLRRSSSGAALQFPYAEPRPHQAILIDRMSQALGSNRPALTMAPTGIGKTSSALLAGLRHGLARNASVYFATATITQRDLVATTFLDIAGAAQLEAGQLTAITMRAKEAMCPPRTMLCHPDHCEYLADYERRAELSGIVEQLRQEHLHVAPDQIYQRAEAERLCPFEVSLDLGEVADLIIGDYNYVYDQSHALGADPDDSADPRARVVIADEAHNLFDRARGYESPFIAAASIESVLSQLHDGSFDVRSTTPPAQLEFEPIPRSTPALFDHIAALLGELSTYADDCYLAPGNNGHAADDCVEVEPDLAVWDEFAQRATDAMICYALYNRRHGVVRPGDPLRQLLADIIRIHDLLSVPRPELLNYAAGPNARQGAGIGILCTNPARQLEACHRRAIGTIAMSATLTPLPYYADVLGFAELNPSVISVRSPFPSENRCVLVVPSIDTRYRQRDRYVDTIASLIRAVIAVRPGNYVAFFPSFAFLEQVRRVIGVAPDRLIVQRSAMTAADRTLALDELKETSGKLLLAVMGGSFAEGVDLPGDALIGSIVVGPSLPPIGFERAAMRRYFDVCSDPANPRGFAYAMLYPGMQRVIQSAGRVIRSMHDRGVIVLVGNRFTRPLYADCLPDDWYRNSADELICSKLVPSLAAFWRNHSGLRGCPDPSPALHA